MNMDSGALRQELYENLRRIGFFATSPTTGLELISTKFCKSNNFGHLVQRGNFYQIDWILVMAALENIDPQAGLVQRKMQYQSIIATHRARLRKKEEKATHLVADTATPHFTQQQWQIINALISATCHQRYQELETRIVQLESLLLRLPLPPPPPPPASQPEAEVSTTLDFVLPPFDGMEEEEEDYHWLIHG